MEEVKNLLKVQNNDITQSKEKILLLESNIDTKYDNIKSLLGWDEEDKEIRYKTNKIVEKETILIVEGKNILTEESVLNYCLDNNYVIVNIRDYKGRIPEILLEAISDYSTKNNIRLESEANLNNLILMCPFTDIRISKKPKRYKKGELDKIILLEKVNKGNKYSEQYYKVIAEVGKKRPLFNMIKSFFLTHTKIINHRNNSFVWFMIFGIHTIFSIIFGNDEYWFHMNNIILSIPLTILFIKAVIPCYFKGGKGDPCLNEHNDNNYTSLSSNHSNNVSTSSHLMIFSSHSFNIRKLRIKNQIGMQLMNLAFLLFFLSIAHIKKCSLVKEKSAIFIELIGKSSDKINNLYEVTTYSKKGILNYNKEIKIIKKK